MHGFSTVHVCFSDIITNISEYILVRFVLKY